MRTGDTVRDGQGTTWVLGPLLGRGLWGKAWTVRRGGDDAIFVMKTALGPDDLRGEVPRGEQALAASREAVLEVARLYADRAFPWLPPLEARLQVEDLPAFILPRYGDTLERRLGEGLALAELVETLLAVTRAVQPRAGGGYHGGLRAGNVFFDEGGKLVLADPLPPAAARSLAALCAHAPSHAAAFPPEVVDGAPGPDVDGWGVCMMLWQGCHAGGPAPNPPRAGLDKAAQVALRDRIHDRLKNEDSNPRFHVRLAERVSVLLARGLSREANPSPPFRFPRLDELATRLDEVVALVRPSVNQVGRILLDRPATRPWFGTDEAVAFSCTVGTTAGVEGPEEIGVGIAVFDVDQDVRLKDLDLGYTCDRHPSGRHRFGFRIEGLGPGRYRARLAFAVRDSGHPPATAETEFTVVAAPGWVPRPAAPAAAPLPFRTDESPTGITEVRVPERRAPEPAPPVVRPEPASPAARAESGPARPVATRAPAAVGPAPVAPPSAPAPRPAAVEAPEPAELPRLVPAPVAEPEATPPAAPPVPPGPPRPPPIASPGAAPSSVRPVARPVVATSVPAPAAEPPARPAPIASPIPAGIDEGEPPEAPTLRPRSGSWADEPLPDAPERNLDAEEDVEAEEEDLEPSFVSRVVHQLRTDPYLAVMTALGALMVILLVLLLLIRE